VRRADEQPHLAGTGMRHDPFGGPMPSPISPVVKSVYVCDEVVRDPVSGKVSVLNLWDTIRLPAGASFPYELAKVCMFAWMREGRGRVRSRVYIVLGATGKVIFKTAEHTLDFASRLTHSAVFRLGRIRFSAPGYYYIELYCENQFIDDQAVQVLTA
jgi:hypothetical protein